MPKLFQKPISPHLSPNAGADDVRLAFWHLVNPLLWFKWRRGDAIERLENSFKQFFQVSCAKSFDSGRTALQAVLEALELNEGDEVLLQAFTCVVVPDAIIGANAKPIYVDIDSTYNLDPEDLRGKINDATKPRAVIVQHTFGHPAQMDEIQQICSEHNLILIEDCAHSLGSELGGKKIGTFGDAAMFSFGRDKVISSVSGGMAITNNPDIGKNLENSWTHMTFPSFFWICQRLKHPVVFAVAKRFYYFFSLGKVLIHFGKKMRYLPLVLTAAEKKGQEQPFHFRMPNVLAKWAGQQFSKLQTMNSHRIKVATKYNQLFTSCQNIQLPKVLPQNDSIFLRYTIEVDDPKKLLKAAKEEGILLGDWYDVIIAPKGSDLQSVGYVPGSCPRAEQAAKRVVNLPTNPQTSLAEVEKVAAFIRSQTDRA